MYEAKGITVINVKCCRFRVCVCVLQPK